MDPITIALTLAKFAPTIAGWLGANKPISEVADIAAKLAQSVTKTSSTDAAIEVLEKDPVALLEYRKAIMAQDMEYEQLYQSDKANARARDMVLSTTPNGNARANWLVVIAIGIICFCLALMIWKGDLTEFAQGAVSMVLGMFLNELKNIYAFEFGTTRRARENSNSMNTMANNIIAASTPAAVVVSSIGLADGSNMPATDNNKGFINDNR